MKSIILLLFMAVAPAFAADSAPQLDPNLQVLAPFLGGWRGEFKQSTPEKPMVDVSRWERRAQWESGADNSFHQRWDLRGRKHHHVGRGKEGDRLPLFHDGGISIERNDEGERQNARVS
jgi:hypothetical protein